jgi:hypothetical protein
MWATCWRTFQTPDRPGIRVSDSKFRSWEMNLELRLLPQFGRDAAGSWEAELCPSEGDQPAAVGDTVFESTAILRVLGELAAC